jgi:hypothetical protein
MILNLNCSAVHLMPKSMMETAYLQTLLTRRSPKQVHYFRVLKNYAKGRFDSLDSERLQWVVNLLQAGEEYLENHAQSYGFHCPPVSE